MSMLSFRFMILCGLFEWKQIYADLYMQIYADLYMQIYAIYADFQSFVYICIAVPDQIVKRGGL